MNKIVSQRIKLLKEHIREVPINFNLLVPTVILLSIIIFMIISGDNVFSEKNIKFKSTTIIKKIDDGVQPGIYAPTGALPQQFQVDAIPQISSNQFNNSSSTAISCLDRPIFIAHDETPVFAEPNELSQRIHTTTGQEFLIDPRYDLKIIGKTNMWLNVKAISPTWPPENLKWSGWIKNSDIYHYKSTHEEALCNFANFEPWTQQANHIILTAKNMAENVLATDKRCHRIADAGYIGTGQRYFLTCYPNDGGKPYHYWFSLLKSPTIDRNTKPVIENIAFESCRNKFNKVIENNRMMKNIQNNIPADDAIDSSTEISAVSSHVENNVWKFQMSYIDDQSREQQSYCFVGPSGIAEIIFPVTLQQ